MQVQQMIVIETMLEYMLEDMDKRDMINLIDIYLLKVEILPILSVG